MLNQKNKRPATMIGAGLVIGAGVGAALGNVGVGIAIGIAIGAALSRKPQVKRDGAKDQDSPETQK